MVAAKHSSGRSVEYQYDKHGKLAHLHDSEYGDEFYRYDQFNRLVQMSDAGGRPLLVNAYGSLSEVTSQTLSDGRRRRFDYGFDEQRRLSSVLVTDDLGYTTRWTRGNATLPMPPGLAKGTAAAL